MKISHQTQSNFQCILPTSSFVYYHSVYGGEH